MTKADTVYKYFDFCVYAAGLSVEKEEQIRNVILREPICSGESRVQCPAFQVYRISISY